MDKKLHSRTRDPRLVAANSQVRAITAAMLHLETASRSRSEAWGAMHPNRSVVITVLMPSATPAPEPTMVISKAAMAMPLHSGGKWCMRKEGKAKDGARSGC